MLTGNERALSETMMTRIPVLLALLGCQSAQPNHVPASDDTGTGATDLDGDDDGFTDDEEASCGSDPADVASTCYACGWKRGVVTAVAEVGDSIGDTIANLALVDQCGDDVPLLDMAGMYHILFLTAAW